MRDVITNRLCPRVTCVRAAALLAVCGVLASGGCGSGSSAGAGPSAVRGRYLVTLCDADPPADIGGGFLVERNPASRDALTVVALPIREPVTPAAQVDVGNSALGSPVSLAVSPDGRFAYVVETRGAPSGLMRTVNDLPPGDSLTAIDLSDPLLPRPAGSVFVGAEPCAVDVHPAGDLLALVTSSRRHQLVTVPVSEGQLGDPVSWGLLGLEDDTARPTSVAWHPSGRALAITLGERDQAVFYAFRREADGELAIASWGRPLQVGRAPIMGRFTPDGRYFATLDANRSLSDAGAGHPAGLGRLTLVRVSDDVDAPDDSRTSHRVVASAPLPAGPVGMAISPDGRLIACVTITSGEGGPGGSISLFTLGRDGSLLEAGSYPIGAVPAGVGFDAAGRFLLVSQYRSLDPAAQDGEVAFWAIRPGNPPRLEQQEFFVGVGAGPHGTVIVR